MSISSSRTRIIKEGMVQYQRNKVLGNTWQDFRLQLKLVGDDAQFSLFDSQHMHPHKTKHLRRGYFIGPAALHSQGAPFGFAFGTQDRTYNFAVATQAERDEWIRTANEMIGNSNPIPPPSPPSPPSPAHSIPRSSRPQPGERDSQKVVVFEDLEAIEKMDGIVRIVTKKLDEMRDRRSEVEQESLRAKHQLHRKMDVLKKCVADIEAELIREIESSQRRLESAIMAHENRVQSALGKVQRDLEEMKTLQQDQTLQNAKRISVQIQNIARRHDESRHRRDSSHEDLLEENLDRQFVTPSASEDRLRDAVEAIRRLGPNEAYNMDRDDQKRGDFLNFENFAFSGQTFFDE